MTCARVLLICAALGACGSIPADPEDTTERVRSERVFRVGLIAGGAPSPERAKALLARVSTAVGATPRFERGAAEPLLLALEAGELDLVVGAVAEDTPWLTRVAPSPPVATAPRGEGRVMLAAFARNGENRWITIVDRAARAVGEAR
jgi:hypothetical protein